MARKSDVLHGTRSGAIVAQADMNHRLERRCKLGDVSMSNQATNEVTNEEVSSRPARAMFGAKRRPEPGPESGPIAEAMRRTESALRQVQHSPPLDTTGHVSDHRAQDQRPDPAPSAPAVAEERAQQLVANISSQMLGELRSLREQIDDLMRDMNERRELISEAIRSHAEFAETAIQHKIIIAESVGKLRAEFEAARTPLPPLRNV
jgi:hypothetical protein